LYLLLFILGKAACGERSHVKLVKSVEEWMAILYNFKRVSLLLNDGDQLCKIKGESNVAEDLYTSIFFTLFCR